MRMAIARSWGGGVGATLVCLLSAMPAARAVPLSFTIDPEQSFGSFALETVDGEPISTPQTPGSDTTNLSGTALIDVDGGNIQFVTTADTQFALQPEDQQPLPGGDPGTAPAQFGLDILVPGTASGVTAARQYVADATSGPIPLIGTFFDSSQVTLDLPSGNTDYNLTILGNPVSGSITENFPALNEIAAGQLVLENNVYTMTMPFLIAGSITISGIPIVPVYSGQIVATAIVPEPSSAALALLGIAAVGVWPLRRRAGGNRVRRAPAA